MTPRLACATILAAVLAGAAEPPPVTYLDAARVGAAFTRGGVLHDEPGFAVHASHRDTAGQVEVHEHETDVIYVLAGTATFVTGGTPLDPRVVAPHELRADDVRGGETRTLAKGDVVIVPAGTPHWFRAVDGPFDYYVVKVR